MIERFPARLNQPPDLPGDFLDPANFLFTADRLRDLDPATGRGTIEWKRHRRKSRIAFEHMSWPLEEVASWEFPAVYPEPKTLPFEVSFPTPRTVRLRFWTRPEPRPEEESPILAGPVPGSAAWKVAGDGAAPRWEGPHGSLTIRPSPFVVELADRGGGVLWRTNHLADTRCMINARPLPFSFVRRAADQAQHLAASLTLHPDEKLFGCGESFTRLDKRGQTVHLWTQDPHGSQTAEMYKPVPFYLSSRGYGVFVHGSTPMEFDLGAAYDSAQVLYTGDETLDLFVLVGDPKAVLEEYTGLTGRSPRPPLWTFGLWMSRITYNAETQVREVAAKLRGNRIPCDVIHLDTGWFEDDWKCDYRFSKTRFADPRRMIADLKRQGFRVCLWQLPYFTPANPLFPEIVERELAVKSPAGGPASEDAVLDFSNPATVAWYQEKLKGLLDIGVGAIKVDFGEGAPLNGLYASGRTGWHEHNLYPLRYNRAAAEVTRRTTGEDIIWARSAWAGSQRYPFHWGGDAEASDAGMRGTLRGGLSLGLSGFSYWSHDVGGFFPATPEPLYRRWLPFGALSSHLRCHGLPPTEPWEFSPGFLAEFRRAVELRYRLLPYLWVQAGECSARGWPMLRPLFFEFPGDPGSWLVEDAYLLGSDLLVAPLFEEASGRPVYLPPGGWVDVQTGDEHRGAGWKELEAGPIPAVVLARAGAAIPVIEVVQHTGAADLAAAKPAVWGKA